MTTAVAWMAPVCALIGICMAAYLGSWVLKQDPGPDKMNSISIKIQQGAKAFLMSEYKLLVIFMVVVGIIMAVALSPITALAFATGGVMSAAAGYAGMHVATRANTRTAHAAEQSVAKALNVSFKSGLTMGLCVASFALLALSLWLPLLVFGIHLVEVAPMHATIGLVEGFAPGASAPALFALSILVVFLCLAALYESWSVPFAVILVVPLGVLGALGAANMRMLSNDVYFQVGLLATIGLSAKNAILIVEFAKELHDKGGDLIEATIEASRMRLRPILMTSLAFLLGILPLAISTGAGAGGQNAIGTGVMGGTFAATVLGIFFVPVFFVLVFRLFNRKAREGRGTAVPKEKR